MHDIPKLKREHELINSGNFLPIEESLQLEFDSEYSYAIFHHCPFDEKYSFFTLRIVETSRVNNEYLYYVCPAIKLDDDMAKRKEIEALVKKNPLNLIPGKLSIDIDDLPKPQLTPENSYYDAKLKRRVPLLDFSKSENEKAKEPKPEKVKVAKEPKPKEIKIESEMCDNTDERIEGQMHSSDFLPPMVCTRLWTLQKPDRYSWGWFLMFPKEGKRKVLYYCRPVEIKDISMEQYSRGGTFFTVAYKKSDFPNLDNEILKQEVLVPIKKQIENYSIECNYIIDAFILNLFR